MNNHQPHQAGRGGEDAGSPTQPAGPGPGERISGEQVAGDARDGEVAREPIEPLEGYELL